MKRNHTGRKALALLLALCMAVVMLPVSALADSHSYSLSKVKQGYRLNLYKPEGLTEWRENGRGVAPWDITEVEFFGSYYSQFPDIPAGSFQDILATSLELPDSVKTIGKEAFAYSAIKSLSVPADIRADKDAFSRADYLTDVTVRMLTGSYSLGSLSTYTPAQKPEVDFGRAKISEIILSGSGKLTVDGTYSEAKNLPKITVKKGATLELKKSGLELSSLTVEEGGNVLNSTDSPVTIEGIAVPPDVNYADCVRITKQPEDVTMVWDPTLYAKFQVEVSDNARNVSCQWYRNRSDDFGWAPIAGETRSEYWQELSDNEWVTTYQSSYKCVVTQTFQTGAGERKLVQETKEAKLSLKDYVNVTEIKYELPETVYAGVPLRLTGSVEPADATVKEIRWSVASGDSGETGAVVKNNELTTTGPGKVKLQATVPNGLSEKLADDSIVLGDYTETYEMEVGPVFVPLTGVEAPPVIVSTEFFYHQDYLELPTAVIPENATRKGTVTWEITGANLRNDYGDSGSIKLRDGNKLELSYGYDMSGSIYLRATVRDGGGSVYSPRDYTQTFIILVGNYPELEQTGHQVTATVGQLPPTHSSSCSTRSWSDYNRVFELTYEWQAYDPETGLWEAAAGENTGREYKIPAGSCGVDENGRVTSAMDGCRLRCIASYQKKQLQAETFTYKTQFVNVTGIVGAATKISVNTSTDLGGVIQPEDASGTQISYTVESDGGTGAKISRNGMLTCTDTGTATIKMTVKNGILNEDGTLSDYTQSQGLKVEVIDVPPEIEPQPPEDVYYVWYNGPSFSVSLDPGFTDPSLAFQWEVSKDDGVNWEILTGNSDYYAANRAELRLPPGSFAEGWEYREGWQYRCKVTTNRGTTTSGTCTIHPREAFETAKVSGLPSILKESTAYNVTVEITPENCLLSSSGEIFTEPQPCELSWEPSENFTINGTGENAWEITPLKSGDLSLQLVLTQGEITRTIDYQVNVALEAPENAVITASGLQDNVLEVDQYGPARLSVTCEGEQLRYRWQSSPDGSTWSDIANADAAGYTVPTQTADEDGTQYRCAVENDAGSVESNVITVKVKAVEQIPPVVITEQPEPMSVLAGTGAVFGVTAEGKDLTYQWQQSADSGENWAEIGGETLDLLVLNTTAADRNGYQYRCAVTGREADGQSVTLTSEAATLTVEFYATVETIEPDFTEFYLHVDNQVSGTAKWSDGAETTDDILWFLEPGGTTAENAALSGENTLTADSEGTVTLVAIVNNGSDPYNLYRQEFTVPVVTDSERTPPTVYSTEDSELTLAQGQKTCLLAAAEPAAGEKLVYQWQQSTDSGKTWKEIEGASSWDYETPPAEADKTVFYRCRVSNDYGEAFTGIYAVTGAAAKPVTKITLSLSELEAGGEPAYLSGYAAIEPTDASYQDIRWNISDAGETGAKLDEFGCLVAEEAGTVTVTATVVNGRLGSKSEDAGSDDASSDYTENFSITVLPPPAKPPEILAQPKDLTVPEGSQALFTVLASGAGVEHRWQRRNSETEEWQDLEEGTEAVYGISQVSKSDSGSQFRCILSNASPETVTTDTATLTVTSNSSGGGGGGSSEPEPDELPFTDVAEKDWFYDSVRYVYEEGLFQGTSMTKFSPESAMTRGMAVTVLCRMAGSPVPEGELEGPFMDVDPNAYYAAAVYWARENGVMLGTGGDRFSPNGSLTREQLAATLYRFAGSPETSGTLDRFTDGASASGYAKQALCWAVEQGILTGRGNNRLDPKGTAKRSEIAAMVTRYCHL